jgi:hypothetical protein
MVGDGHQAFVRELARFAAATADGRLTAIAERAAAPLRVAVRGRRGVGRTVVARALDRVAIVDTEPDLVVYVIAEVVKPEDVRAVQAERRRVLGVLNKADVTGFAGDGPMGLARARCKHFSALLGVPVEPMIGLLAVAAHGDVLDDASWAALRRLAANASTDFGPRLVDTLGPLGVAVAVAALRRGKTAAQVRALLRWVSGVDAVSDQVAAVGTEVCYRRVLDAVADLQALAVSDGEIGEFLARDDAVLARMAAALDFAGSLAESTGLQVGSGHDRAAHLAEAVRWQRYSRGPVSDVHRACGADIARGSLRLWSRAGRESG